MKRRSLVPALSDRPSDSFPLDVECSAARGFNDVANGPTGRKEFDVSGSLGTATQVERIPLNAPYVPAGRRSTRILLGVLFGLLSIGAGGAFWGKKSGQPVSEKPTTSVPAAEVIGGVGALGRLEPGWKIIQVAPASSPDGARVEALYVDEGDEVQTGALLAILDTQARRTAAIQEARAHVAVAVTKLKQIQAGVKSDELAAQEALIAKQEAAQKNSLLLKQRAERLFAAQAIAEEEYEQRKSDCAVNQALLEHAKLTLAAMKLVRPEDVAVAEAEVLKAEAGLARAQAELDAARIVAPIAGRILKIHARPGERIGEVGLVEIGDTAAMQAVAEVYERDVLRVRIGQRARVKIQSLPEELPGEVVQIGWKVGRRVVLDNDPIKDTDARVVEVRIQLDPAAGRRVARLSYARVEVFIDAPTATEGT